MQQQRMLLYLRRGSTAPTGTAGKDTKGWKASAERSGQLDLPHDSFQKDFDSLFDPKDGKEDTDTRK